MISLSNYASDISRNSDGIWYANKAETVSYPSEGNDQCFEIEDMSFWFQHRNACIIELVKRFPPRGKGPIFDVGGGNGFVAKGLVDAGWDVVLVEPGRSGALNAKKRGLQHVVCATIQSAKFSQDSLPAIGLFDVLEHIEDDVGFMKYLYNLLEPGGMLYLTVPGYGFLWSDSDNYGGHFRRYKFGSLKRLFEKVGFKFRFIAGIFLWLVIPILLFRAIPYRLRERKKNLGNLDQVTKDHTLPEWLKGFTKKWHRWECIRIKQELPIRIGASLLLAATK